MSGDDLTIALFLFGTAIAFGLTAVTLAGWTNRALVVSLFGVAAILFVCSIFWPTIGENWIGLKRFFQALIATYFGFRAVGLLIFLMFCFDFAIKMRWIPLHRTDKTVTREADRIDEREFVDATPLYLTELLKDKLEIHGLKLTDSYIGKWLHITGNVIDVSPDCIVLPLDQLNSISTIYLNFDMK
jgi:hypothetical protein